MTRVSQKPFPHAELTRIIIGCVFNVFGSWDMGSRKPFFGALWRLL
jgi:hypothetical protein